ncbi:MAG: CYTH domain-containing protein [Candidatus Doudnabacteria bacterium]|nr:CYTH domain-containing protein [Candidatus Doudnabacteria bacterium]
MEPHAQPAHVPVEAEVKLVISEAEYESLSARLLELGFGATPRVAQEDYYIEHEASDLGGMNFSRLRKEDSTYTWNRKHHALDSQGEKVRLEETKDLSEAEFYSLLSSAPSEPIIIRKDRQNYTGTIETWPATVSLDMVVMNEVTKYFIEVEVMTDIEHGVAVRRLCKDWAVTVLGVTGMEAPGYLKQYLNTSPS